MSTFERVHCTNIYREKEGKITCVFIKEIHNVSKINCVTSRIGTHMVLILLNVSYILMYFIASVDWERFHCIVYIV